MNIYQNDDFGYTFTKNPEQFKEGKLFYVGSDGEKHTLKRVDSPFHALGAIFLPSTLPEYFTHIRRQVMKHAKTRGYRWEDKLKRKAQKYHKNQTEEKAGPFVDEIIRLTRYISLKEFEAVLIDANKQFFKQHKIH